MKNKWIILMIAILLPVLVLTACAGSKTDKIERFAKASPSNGENISVPGYGSLNFSAGEKVQKVNLANPPENACVFVQSLILNETGEVLWKGAELSPGEAFTRIVLNRALEAGSYPATLKYECYSIEGKKTLNGTDIKLTIEVQ